MSFEVCCVSSTDVRQITACPNCSTELGDEYCPRCGQRRIDSRDLSARAFLHDVADEVANLRTNFKTLRTLRALLVPGRLTAEYLAGRRRPYLGPLKIYLICAAIFFLLAPVAGFSLAALLEADRSGTVARLVSARAAERALDRPLLATRFDLRVQTVYTVAVGVIAVLFAMMLQVIFRKQHRPFGAHLVFALHFVSFMYLLTVVAGASRTIGLSADVAATAAYALLTPYLIVALKRVYAESIGVILLKALALLAFTTVLNNLASVVAIRLTLALV